MSDNKRETLFINTEILESLEDGMCLHPLQLKYANKIEKNSFDDVFIKNTPSSMLSHKSFFYINKLLKERGKVEIIVSQKISVLQDLDSQEIESNAKLAGFVSIETDNFEHFEKDQEGHDVKKQSLKITMLK